VIYHHSADVWGNIFSLQVLPITTHKGTGHCQRALPGADLWNW